MVSGVLLLDKPLGLSSNLALQQVRRLYSAAKAGHTGTLDPLATGLLPVCFGEATKFSHALLDADKTYQATIKLGVTTTTGDAEGEVTAQSPVAVSPQQMVAVLACFSGVIEQMPPMHSALKHQGRPLYAYARAGVAVERTARQVTVHDLHCDSFAGDLLGITVRVSKGTYIRVLADDIGAALGCGGYLLALRRTAIDGLRVDDAVTLEHLKNLDVGERDRLLAPCDSLLGEMPECILDEASAVRLQQGLNVPVPVQDGLVRLYAPQRRFLGLGVARAGTVAPKRLLAAGDGRGQMQELLEETARSRVE